MKEQKYHIRSYRPADFEGYLHFYLQANRIGRLGMVVSPKLLAEDLNFPERSPEQNLFIAESRKNIVGFCEVIPEIGIGRVLLNALVHPRHRRKGVGSALFHAALSRGRDLHVQTVHVDIFESNEAAGHFLSGHGFEIIRRYCQLQINMAGFRDEPTNRSPFTVRPMRENEGRLLTTIQNQFFKGSWGFHPNTLEEITYMINLGGASHEDVLLTFEGERTVGYCWTRVDREANQRLKTRRGRIHMIGVDPEYRGSGLGKLTLRAGLNRLKAEGIEVVKLTVDSNNQVALKLYHSMGFTLHANILWFERTV